MRSKELYLIIKVLMRVRLMCKVGFIGILLTGCSENEAEILPEPYVGTWRINKVIKDGELQNEWANVRLTMLQTYESGGTYYLPESPYDTIWNAYGTWEKFDQQTFLLDESIETNYQRPAKHELLLTYVLPWTGIPCDIDNPETDGCPLSVTGQWSFYLTRIR